MKANWIDSHDFLDRYKEKFSKIYPVVFLYQSTKKIILLEKFKRDFNDFKHISSQTESRFSIKWSERYPCLNDATTGTDFDRHYIFHTAWAARILSRNKPAEHVDISSSLYFVSIVSAFIKIKFYDYRPANLNLSNLESEHADLTSLPFLDESISSLSCMHVIEHVGLGRYGDPIRPDGDLKAIREIKRVLSQGADLIFVIPIGKPKIMFNAHRIYSYKQIINYFKSFELKEFALIPDNPKDGGLVLNATEEMADEQNYGCGCFWFKK
ncbi:DUF268 domain-containing protein [Methanolobus mangrovi]|uniref:DUF268 domain-containing protein n=1 Tax=Methanolobus mangrovi TaxID=3072977 RepID=A0AA51UHG8_9EURY|nr:DUF268 domain-containing protein [Methanolobus mangrovi]WMW22222.1 DUF268 domain-containing protein [Methanolobus mangrovi]